MEIDGFVNHELCSLIIEKYKNDSKTKPNGLTISNYKEWDEINEKLFKIIKTGHTRYINYIDAMFPNVPEKLLTVENYEFRIENHEKGYNWVFPSLKMENNRNILFKFFIHLNDVTEGGETDFLYKKVKPTTGKLVIFPSTWTSLHRGLECKDKYVITGTFYSKAP